MYWSNMPEITFHVSKMLHHTYSLAYILVFVCVCWLLWLLCDKIICDDCCILSKINVSHDSFLLIEGAQIGIMAGLAVIVVISVTVGIVVFYLILRKRDKKMKVYIGWFCYLVYIHVCMTRCGSTQVSKRWPFREMTT